MPYPPFRIVGIVRIDGQPSEQWYEHPELQSPSAVAHRTRRRTSRSMVPSTSESVSADRSQLQRDLTELFAAVT